VDGWDKGLGHVEHVSGHRPCAEPGLCGWGCPVRFGCGDVRSWCGRLSSVADVLCEGWGEGVVILCGLDMG